MTTPVPEPDPYAGSGGSDPDVWEDLAVRPAVPGWTAGQEFYTGPIYDDTGWHIDLSGVDWGRESDPDQDSWPPSPPHDGTPTRRPTLRFRSPGPPRGNGAAGDYPGSPSRPGPTDGYAGDASQPDALGRYQRPPPQAGTPGGYAGPDGAADARPQRSRSGGRHARPVRSEDQPPARPGTRPGSRPGMRRIAPPLRTRPRPAGPPPLPGQLPPLPPDTARPVVPGTAQPGPPTPSPLPPGAGRPGQAVADAVLPGAAQVDVGSASIVKSSGVMAIGTLGSRLTGFLRTIAQSYALGVFGIAAAYNLSNTLPNVVYNLALGGILTSVIVPLIVNAARRDAGQGGYDQRMFTLVTAALAGVTLLAMLAAVPIVHLYAGSTITRAPATLHLAVIFALFFIPQIFFYGISSLIGAILNSRGSFAAPMWTPIVNNLVVIAVLGMYVAMAGLRKDPATISGTEVALLGLGTTLGIVAQTIALVPSLRRVGFRWHPRTDFRRAEVNEIGRMAGWMFGYVGATQVAFLVTTKVALDASQAGVTEYNYAWLLFQLPYAVVGISVITALLPRMSAHAAVRRYGRVRQDFSTGIRLAGAIVVPCSLVLAVLGPKLGELFFGHGDTSAAEARYMGLVFAVFCLGLLPYMIFQLQLRVFYALHDSKTPAFIGLVTMTVNIVANVIALHMLPPDRVVAGLGAGFGLANLVGMVISWRILTRRLRGLDGYHICRSLVRMHAAALPAALLAIIVGILTGNAVVDVVIGGALATTMYVLFARALRIDEITGLTRTVLARLGR